MYTHIRRPYDTAIQPFYCDGLYMVKADGAALPPATFLKRTSATWLKRTSIPRDLETMNHDPDTSNKEHRVQGNRNPGTVFTLSHFASSSRFFHTKPKEILGTHKKHDNQKVGGCVWGRREWVTCRPLTDAGFIAASPDKVWHVVQQVR